MSGESNDKRAEAPGRNWITWRRALLVFTTLLSFGGCFGAGVLFGVARNQEAEYHERYLRERELVEPILASDPAFADIKVSRRSSGGISLTGAVSSPQDRLKLFEALIRVVGEPRAKELIIGVAAFS
jgi:hypothetical protein